MIDDKYIDPPKPEIVLKIDLVAHLVAADLGELLASISYDYDRFTGGRKLFVRSIESGSVVFYLQDLWGWISAAAPYAEGVAATAGFVKTIVDLWEKLAHAKYTQPKKYSRAIGARTVRAALKVAAQSDGEVDMRIRDSEISLHITPVAAKEYLSTIEDNIHEPAAVIGHAEPEPSPSNDADEASASTSDTDLPITIRQILDRRSSFTELELKRLVSILKSTGYRSVITLLAEQFDAMGDASTAKYLREEAAK